MESKRQKYHETPFLPSGAGLLLLLSSTRRNDEPEAANLQSLPHTPRNDNPDSHNATEPYDNQYSYIPSPAFPKKDNSDIAENAGYTLPDGTSPAFHTSANKFAILN